MDWQTPVADHYQQQQQHHKRHPFAIPYTVARRAEQAIAWPDLAQSVETGDIALFSGQSLVSRVIKWAELGSHWSHMAMFVRESDGSVRLWESTNADGQVDLMTQMRKGGPRLVDAETAIRAYLRSSESAKVILRRLYIDQSIAGTELADPVSKLPQLREFMQSVSHLPYERNPVELVRAVARAINLVYAWESQSSYFCSELIAAGYTVLGLFPNSLDRHPALYTPMDFAQESQDLPFWYDRRTNASLVSLGPHLDIVFPYRGPEPLPPRMDKPTRLPMRLDF